MAVVWFNAARVICAVSASDGTVSAAVSVNAAATVIRENVWMCRAIAVLTCC